MLQLTSNNSRHEAVSILPRELLVDGEHNGITLTK